MGLQEDTQKPSITAKEASGKLIENSDAGKKGQMPSFIPDLSTETDISLADVRLGLSVRWAARPGVEKGCVAAKIGRIVIP